MFRKLANLAAAAMAAVALVAMSGCGSGDDTGPVRPPDYRSALAGAPQPLARLYAKGDQLLRGGPDAFGAELNALRGHSVVVNKWASWCEPCRREFPLLQRASARFGDRVAFVGVDANDSSAAARTFLKEFPLPYPSYSDPNQDISRMLGATAGFPATAFYDSSGQLVFVKQGPYASQADLVADIRRHAMGG